MLNVVMPNVVAPYWNGWMDVAFKGGGELELSK
jgi:hypothetical protein